MYRSYPVLGVGSVPCLSIICVCMYFLMCLVVLYRFIVGKRHVCSTHEGGMICCRVVLKCLLLCSVYSNVKINVDVLYYVLPSSYSVLCCFKIIQVGLCTYKCEWYKQVKSVLLSSTRHWIDILMALYPEGLILASLVSCLPKSDSRWLQHQESLTLAAPGLGTIRYPLSVYCVVSCLDLESG